MKLSGILRISEPEGWRYLPQLQTEADSAKRGLNILSLEQQVKNCCPAKDIKNKMAAKLASLETRIFEICVDIK